VFEAKFDGFRAAADTVRGRLISGNGNWMHRFDEVLDLLPRGYVFDGVRIPTMPSGHTELKASTRSDLMPSTVLR
jgi:hypothetical protein